MKQPSIPPSPIVLYVEAQDEDGHPLPSSQGQPGQRLQAVCPFSRKCCQVEISGASAAVFLSASPHLRQLVFHHRRGKIFFKFEKTRLTPETLTLLTIPVPGVLLEALDFPAAARYLGYWWERTEETLRCCDGQRTADGNWRAWLTYTEHPAVRPGLAALSLSSAEKSAQDALLVDRAALRAYGGAQETILEILTDQWYPPGQSLVVTADLENALPTQTPDSPAETQDPLRRENSLLTRLVLELDQHRRRH
jgi:hypothetical protein